MLCARLLVCGLALAGSAGAQSIATNSPDGKPLSDRIVHYTIEAKYDARAHALDATETLAYQNKTGQPLDTFPFHLYLNAFQPESSWTREAHRDNRDEEWEEKYRGAIDIKEFAVDGFGDLTRQLQFVAPDDGNAADKTVVQVKLPRPIRPGEVVTFRIRFHDQFPETVARTGYKRDFIMGAQWFPKVGVWWHGAWNCHQFHETTEFFSDFGVYDVKLTLPQEFVTGASGVEVASSQNPDHTRTFTWHGEDIHDFAWAASPHFIVFEDTFPSSLGPVKMRALMHSGHRDQGPRHLTALRETMRRFEQWYGPYPYRQITLIDPEPGSAAGGMEYPTLFTAGTAWWMPRGLRLPEIVTEHEFGHQYWYGMVATNEFEEAWLDEGINTYVEGKVLDDWLGAKTSFLGLLGATMDDTDFSRAEFLGAADLDPMTRRAYQFLSGGSYGSVTYGKTDMVLRTLEGIIGEDKVQLALRTWFQRYRFTHPTGEDFLRTLQEVSGRDLRPFFAAAVDGTQVLDYQVRSLNSEPLEWWKETPREKAKDTVYHTEVVVHRKGDFVFPVDLAVTFEGGETVREHWDGRDRWARFTWDRKARAVSAEIDPDHKVGLDRDRFNNSRRRESVFTATRKLQNYWMVATQWLAQVFLWLF